MAQIEGVSSESYPEYKDLKGKSVFVTGGGSGIGAYFVHAFAAQGAKVAFVSLTEKTGNALCEAVEAETGIRPYFQPCDIRDADALQQAVRSAAEKNGAINILINNAARDTRHSVDEFTAEQWNDSFDTNLRPHFLTAQVVAPAMREMGEGSIINVGSNSAHLGLSGYPAYVSAKAAITGLTRALARELGVDGIRVNTLIPGWVMTQRQKDLWVTDEALQDCLNQQCLKDTLSGEDCANAALFLASNASRMMTGQSVIIDGGRALT